MPHFFGRGVAGLPHVISARRVAALPPPPPVYWENKTPLGQSGHPEKFRMGQTEVDVPKPLKNWVLAPKLWSEIPLRVQVHLYLSCLNPQAYFAFSSRKRIIWSLQRATNGQIDLVSPEQIILGF